MVFPLVAVIWHTNFIILSGQNLSFDRPGASGDHFVSLGTPEGTMEGHMGAQNQTFSDFCRFGDPVLNVFLSSHGSNSMFLLELVSRSLFASIFK